MLILIRNTKLAQFAFSDTPFARTKLTDNTLANTDRQYTSKH